MLKNITIKNLAVIETVHLDFARGFTVLTGETGAGKSIIIDAIGLATGERADPTLIRSGESRAEVTLSFDIAPNSPAARWLHEQALDDADQPETAVLRRIVHDNGRTRGWINGNPVNASQLRELGNLLIQIFGQSESLTLLRADVQRERLDRHGHLQPELAAVAAAAQAANALETEIASLRAAADGDPARLDYLRFQVGELVALALQPGEIEQIEAEHRQLANAQRILQDTGALRQQLYEGETNLHDQLGAAAHQLQKLAGYNPVYATAAELLSSAQTQVEEAVIRMRDAADRLDLDGARSAELDRRLAAIHELARKHRVAAAQLPALAQQLREQLDRIEHAAERLEALQARHADALQAYHAAADRLHAARQAAALTLSAAVTAQARPLGMPKAQLAVSVIADPSRPVRGIGSDDVRFDFSANPGQALRPLAKVASGGELSRLSLALQVTDLQTDAEMTLIFDEVDSGISGAVAEVVGATLRRLGDSHQVLCVTHLAQVAAQGHQHCTIRKQVTGETTLTRVDPVEGEARVAELARIQAGTTLTDAALAHAREMLQSASGQRR